MGSTVVGIRLPDDVYSTLKGRAGGISVSQYIKQQILKSIPKAPMVSGEEGDPPAIVPMVSGRRAGWRDFKKGML